MALTSNPSISGPLISDPLISDPLISDPLILLAETEVGYGNQRIATIDRMILPKKGVYAILGPSGCGKSTLLRLLSGLYEAPFYYKGVIQEQSDTPLRYSMIWQTPTVFPCSIYDNLWVAIRHRSARIGSAGTGNTGTCNTNKDTAHQQPTFFIEKALEHWRTRAARYRARMMEMTRALQDVGLYQELGPHWTTRSAETLSGGQKQRLCMAMGLLKQAGVILLDEPTSSLDPIATQRVEEIIQSLGRERLVILVTHSIGQATRLAHYATILCCCPNEGVGYACETGEALDVLQNPQTESCRQFIEAELGAMPYQLKNH